MPVQLSTLFGEWLYLLRAALDGIVYHLAVRDSGQNPPPAERSLQFPVFLDPAKYDSADHRGNLRHSLSADVRLAAPGTTVQRPARSSLKRAVVA
ncbi:MAG: hypothetical protein QOD10_3965 [Mycobacterium sp.]|jgi:hypothetical protein|nr:hypothetical protein [Mycobacterium sp.]